MIEGFVTWDMLKDYTTLVSIVFIIVAFTKRWTWIERIDTQKYSALVAFCLIVGTQLYSRTFRFWDTLIYAISAIIISMTANGVHNTNKSKGLK